MLFGLAAILAVSGAADAHDLTRLPLGDGKISTGPKAGWIWACRIDPNGGGAQTTGPWIKADGTFDFTKKATVPGDVRWPSRYSMRVEGENRVFALNDLPNHGTGTFPVPASSEAYRYDRNPNTILAQNFTVTLPANPVLAPQPGCAPGAVGILLSGAVLFNALDAPGRDAVAHETQDKCQGHPQQAGVYHYHSLTTCIDDKRAADGHSMLAGYALDGFGIFGRFGEGGRELASADLDECHGHTHDIEWNGKRVRMYHYHATWDFPYTIGCLRGAYTLRNVMAISGRVPRAGVLREPQGGRMGGGPPGDHPDLAAAALKLHISEEQLRTALGPPPPDLAKAANTLGISEQELRAALGVP